jgi:hypothetical protein
MKCHKRSQTWTDSLDKQPKLKKVHITFLTWNARSLYGAGSLMAVEKQISKYKLDLVGVQELRWDGSSTEPVGECIFFYGKGNEYST